MKILDAGQQKRLMGIAIQVNGAGAVVDPAVAKELNLTDDQKKQLAEVRQKNMEALRDAFQGGRDQGGREKIQELRDEANKKMMAVLTSDQQAQLESLKGDKVDIDMSQLRGPGGPGGRGDGGRGRAARWQFGVEERREVEQLVVVSREVQKFIGRMSPSGWRPSFLLARLTGSIFQISC